MRQTAFGLGLIAFVVVATGVQAQAPTYKRDVPDSLAHHAKISEAAAAATAQKRVPKGEIQSMELEREHGRLIYSFDMKVPGRSGVEEVNVSATTGKVVAREHESAAAEAKEEKAEGKEQKSAKESKADEKKKP